MQKAKQTMPLPKLKVIFHYGAHGSEYDARHIPAMLERYKPHFYCPETGALAADRIPKAQRDLESYRELDEQTLSKRIRIEPSGKRRFQLAEISALKKAPETRIWFLEHYGAADAQRISDEYDNILWKLNQTDLQFCRGDLTLAKYHYARAIKALSSSRLNREKNFIDNAEKALPELLKEYPELKKEDEIRILARSGTEHRKKYSALHGLSQEISVERVFDAPPVSSPEMQWLQRSRVRKELADLDKETIAKGIAAHHISMMLEKIGAKSPMFEHLGVNLANELTHKDVEDVAGRINQLLGEGVDEFERVETAFREKFKEKEISLPTDEEGAKKLFKERVLKKWGKKWKEPFYASVP